MLNNTINIIYATDKNYLPICSTSIISLLDNNKDFERINIHILTLDLGEKEITEFRELEKIFKNVNFYFYYLDQLIKVYSMDDQDYSLAGYLRIFSGRVLSQNIKKVLYLDGDTLIMGSLKDLWNIDLEENICGGVLDLITKEVKSNIGLKENDKYFNAGVMLINLEKWRNENIENKLIDFLNFKRGKVYLWDQGLLNSVIRNWKELPAKFNVMSPYKHFNRKQLIKIFNNEQICTEEEIKEAKENSIIIHDKLWAKYWIHPNKKDFRKYNKLSSFGKPIDKVKKNQKINNWLQHLIPLFLYIPIWKWQWKRKIAKKGLI